MIVFIVFSYKLFVILEGDVNFYGIKVIDKFFIVLIVCVCGCN